MRYDLLLQSLVPGTPFDSDRVEALLEARGAKVLPGGGRSWLLEEGSVEFHPLRENGQWIATEVRVPLLERTDLVREVVQKVGELAQEAGVRFFDPQLGQELSSRGETRVLEQYERTARYAAEMGGEASAMSIDRGDDSPGFQPTTKMALGVLSLFALLYIVMRWINGQLHGH